jgi:cytochrome c oxidase cbb3-type subunit 3
VIGIGKGRLADYEADMAEAAVLAAKNNPLANITAEQLVTASTDPAQHALGSSTFATMCSSCHLADGGGLIGPNLTDRYWLHGNKPLEIFKTITEGVAAKGMPPWGKTLKPAQLVAVAGYIMTLRGTTPKTPKPPQGIDVDSVAAVTK